MSLTHDAVAALKNTFLPGLQKSERKLIEAPLIEESSPPTAPDLLEQSLLAVARDSADIRRSHDAILAKAASLTTLQEDLLEAFDRALLAIEQLAEARSQVAKAEAVAKFEREERGVAAQRLASMTASYHQTVSEVEKLRPENKRLETSLRQTSDRLALQEAEAAGLADQLRDARGEAERARAAEAQARRETEAANAELASANAFVSRKIAEISQLGERCEIAEQAARASNRALEEARADAAGARVRLDEERVNLASAQSRISALEAQLKDLGAKFSDARAGWSQEAERFNETVGRLKEDLAQALGRDEAHQRLLTAAQSETGALRAQVGDLEAQLAEARLAGGQAGARAAGAEAERDDLAKEVASAKRLHQSLLRRVKPMISALREKNAETLRLAATQSDLERRFHDYQSEAGEAIRALQDREAQLIADLEAERARRVVAEGALAIDRSFRPTETQRRKLAQDSEAPRLTSATIAARPNRPPAD
jgi:chromosome segregation ATPase